MIITWPNPTVVGVLVPVVQTNAINLPALPGTGGLPPSQQEVVTLGGSDGTTVVVQGQD